MASAGPPAMGSKVLRLAARFSGLAVFILALVVLQHALEQHQYHDILRYFHALPKLRLWIAAACVASSYLVLTLYDVLALRYVGQPLPYRQTGLASFVAFAVSHNVGPALLTSGSLRTRFYSAWGLGAGQIARLLVFCTITSWLGFLGVGGVVFVGWPLAFPQVTQLPFVFLRVFGLLGVAVVSGYLLWSALGAGSLKVREWRFTPPRLRLSVPQVLLASFDWSITAVALYALLPRDAGVPYPLVLGVLLLSELAGSASQVPGGLGVLEAVGLLLLSPAVGADRALGAMIAFRGLYYLLPFGAALLAFGAYEVWERKEPAQRVARAVSQGAALLVPHLFALTTLSAGAILLVSGALPTSSWRLEWLRRVMPLPILEISHFLGSLVGTGLVLLAIGLQRRLDAAYHSALALLAAGIVLSLLKGFDYVEALALALMLATLLPSRRHFYRKASLVSQRFTPGWVMTIAIVVLGSTWLGFFVHKHVEYGNELWWYFAFRGDASRFLRGSVGVAAVVLAFAVAKLLRGGGVRAAPPSRDDLECVERVVEGSPRAATHLALLGDKMFLFSEDRSAFLMYAVRGRSWIALGNPVGSEEMKDELAWRFRELCDRYDGWPVFYELGPQGLHRYLDLGLALHKIGEEGRVPLSDFSLEGSQRRELRYLYRRPEREGCVFEVAPAEEVGGLIPELADVSETWLKAKHTKEKGFSLGYFSEDYLKRNPVGLVRKAEKIVAFGNVLQGAGKEELAVDLMRYLPDEAPYGTMDALFIHIMLWGKDQGYRWFNLGCAPLAGLEDHPLAPLWDRVGTLVFRYGEHFYNFQGLRQYKAKFDPVWEPRYLACPSGLVLPRVLTDLVVLTSGGMRGVVGK